MAERFDIKGYKRKPEAFKNTFKEKDNATITKDKVYVIFPERFVKKELAVISVDFVKVVGIYAILNEKNEYCVINTPIFHELLPISVKLVDIDEDTYVLCEFEKDTIFLSTNDLIVLDSFVYDLFNEIFIQANVPWYLEYEDLAMLFRHSKKYANMNIGNEIVTWEVLTATITRYSSDKTKYHRQMVDKPYSYVGLNDIRYGYDNTGARIIGGYMKEGITTAIIDKEKETSDTSRLLRA